MTDFEEDDVGFVARQVSEEAANDYVGLWEVHSLLMERGNSTSERIVQVVASLLQDERIEIGQFTDGVFHAWPGEKEKKLSRLRQELDVLQRPPDIGDVAWLVMQ